MEQFDVVYIGTGPGGYTGAIRAAQLGLKTAVIEKDATYGGTCLNVGCIPSKALLDSSENFDMAKKHFAEHGIKVPEVGLDLPAMLARKDKVVKGLTDGVAFLFKKNKITPFKGKGTIVGPNEVRITGADGSTQTIGVKNIVISTGSVPVELPFARFDGKRILSSTEALSLPEVPRHLVVIGGGVIGLELGSVWLRLGAQVTVVEYNDKIAGGTDKQIATQLQRVLEKQGFKFMLGAKVTNVEASGNGVTVKIEGKNGEPLPAIGGDYVLVAVGRKPYTDGLGLENVGIATDKGRVPIDEHTFRVGSHSHIYAIGDAVRGPMLAHKAEEEGIAVAEIIAGKAGHVNYLTCPGVIYTWPEVASVGYTEEQVKEMGVPYKVGTFPFTANGRAKAHGFTDGLAKVIADEKTDKVLGVHILGPRASDMIAEAAMAMEFSASSEDIARAFHAHPTFAEVLREAALAVDKRARQM